MYVADRDVPLVYHAASNSNSKLPVKLMILRGKHRILWKEQHTLLLQRTFETILNHTHKEE